MDIASIATMLIGMLGQVPVVGHVLQIVMPYIIALPVVITGVVGLWHSVVLLLQGLGKLPGLTKLAALGDAMSTTEAKVQNFENSTLMPIINRLSAIPLPKVAEAPADQAK